MGSWWWSVKGLKAPGITVGLASTEQGGVALG